MRIAISGVERSLGRFLCQKFLDDSHEVVIVPQELLKDTLSLIAIYEGCTCVINLVGEEAYECMQSSDVESIRDEQNGCIVEAFANMKKLPELFICISSNVVTSKIKGVRLISQWEKEVMGAENHGVRSVAYATNIILGKNEMTKKLFSVFKRGFGRGFKNSDAFFNWVHQDDIYGAILWAIEDKSVKGAYNLVAPDSMKNSKFYELLSTTVEKRSLMPLSPFYLRQNFKDSIGVFYIKKDLAEHGMEFCGFNFKHIKLANVLSELK